MFSHRHQAQRAHAGLAWVGDRLLAAYAKAGKQAEASRLARELLAQARQTLPPDSPQLAGRLAQLGLTLLEQEKGAEAEPLLRECLAIRQKKEPGEWATCLTQARLGAALLGQKKYAAAEPLLVQGCEGMRGWAARLGPSHYSFTRGPLAEGLKRLVALYDPLGKPAEAARYRKELEAIEEPAGK